MRGKHRDWKDEYTKGLEAEVKRLKENNDLLHEYIEDKRITHLVAEIKRLKKANLLYRHAACHAESCMSKLGKTQMGKIIDSAEQALKGE